MKLYRLVLAAAMLGGTALGMVAPAFSATAPADTVFVDGYVYTVNKTDQVAQAIAVRDGRIAYVGTNTGVKAFVGPRTHTVDLHGHMLMPGLVDGHMHPLFAGRQLIACDLNYAALTVDEFSSRIRACLVNPVYKSSSGWTVVGHWFQEAMKPEGTHLTKEVLDRIDATHPIVVQSSFFHTFLANSAALRLAHVTAETPSPAGGSIGHDANGQPNGMFEDSAAGILMNAIPQPSVGDDLQAVRTTLALLRSQGVTGFLDALALDQSLNSFTALQKSGQLTARAHFAHMIDPKTATDVAGNVATLKALAARYDQGPIVPSPGITLRNAKLFMDGVISAPAQTGRLLAPYLVNKGTKEKPDWQAGASYGPDPYFSPKVLAPLLEGIAQAGFDPHMHADGDGAVRIALDAVQTLRHDMPKIDVRPAIAHDEMVDPADWPRFKATGSVAVLSFQWEKQAADTIDSEKDFIGPKRFSILEPSSLLEKAGARIAYGSDWPIDPLNEWFALKVGVTRTNDPSAGPQYAKPLGDEPGLSRATAIRAITFNSSWELRQDQQTGSLEAGKLADLIILDRNVMQVPAEDIAQTKVLLTMVGGKVVYSTGEFAPSLK